MKHLDLKPIFGDDENRNQPSPGPHRTLYETVYYIEYDSKTTKLLIDNTLHDKLISDTWADIHSGIYPTKRLSRRRQLNLNE